MSSWLQHNQSVKPTQPSSPARPMASCTLTDHIVPGTHILTNVAIMPERENVLKKGGIPEENGNRREHNDVEEAIAGPSTIDTDQSPSRHIPTMGVITMIIQ